MRKKIIQVMVLLALGTGLAGAGWMKDGISPVYKDYFIYDAYKEDGKNLAKQAIGLYFPFRSTYLYLVFEKMDNYVKSDNTEWPTEFIEYLKDAVRNGQAEEALETIPCDYKILDKQEKEHLRKKYPELQKYYGGDTWYQADLSRDGKDLVVSKRTCEGYDISYILVNDGGSYPDGGHFDDQPTFGGGQKKCMPHFVRWEDDSYVVFAYRDKEQKEIVGLIIYDCSYYFMDALSIGMNQDGTFQVIPWGCWNMMPGGEKWLEPGTYNYYLPAIEAY